MPSLKNSKLEVTLFEEGLVEIESPSSKNVSVEIKAVDGSDSLTPPGALFRIEMYKAEEKSKAKPFEYDSAWIMQDGTLLKRGKEYTEYMRKVHS